MSVRDDYGSPGGSYDPHMTRLGWLTCGYCGRRDEPYETGNCRGCGASRDRGHITQTAFGPVERLPGGEPPGKTEREMMSEAISRMGLMSWRI